MVYVLILERVCISSGHWLTYTNRCTIISLEAGQFSFKHFSYLRLHNSLYNIHMNLLTDAFAFLKEAWQHDVSHTGHYNENMNFSWRCAPILRGTTSCDRVRTLPSEHFPSERAEYQTIQDESLDFTVHRERLVDFYKIWRIREVFVNYPCRRALTQISASTRWRKYKDRQKCFFGRERPRYSFCDVGFYSARISLCFFCHRILIHPTRYAVDWKWPK